jgi:dephospho-CoA kinase
MQDEIQRQIDAHRGSSAVVVLDFPLLAENPRRGLAATIVVDIDPALAIDRLVEQRGMDREDAVARVNSQIGRTERLATATHVVDNGGDRAALERQVDAVWAELSTMTDTAATTDTASMDPS